MFRLAERLNSPVYSAIVGSSVFHVGVSNASLSVYRRSGARHCQIAVCSRTEMYPLTDDDTSVHILAKQVGAASCIS